MRRVRCSISPVSYLFQWLFSPGKIYRDFFSFSCHLSFFITVPLHSMKCSTTVGGNITKNPVGRRRATTRSNYYGCDNIAEGKVNEKLN